MSQASELNERILRLLGKGMNKAARAADTEQSDREYILQRQRREKEKKEKGKEKE